MYWTNIVFYAHIYRNGIVKKNIYRIMGVLLQVYNNKIVY